jgi:hypothetical protein
VDLLMPTKSGADMMRDYHDWIRGPAFVNTACSSPPLHSLIGRVGHTQFVALLPPQSTFAEMVMDVGAGLGGGGAGVGVDDRESPSPSDLGFDSLLSKPLQISEVVSVLKKPRVLPSSVLISAPLCSIPTASPPCPSSPAQPQPSSSFLSSLLSFFTGKKVHPSL